MNFVLLSSLKHQSVVKISTLIWNLFFEQNLSKGMKCRKIEGEVSQIVTNLPLPESLKNEILNHVPVVGHQILKWLEFHETQLGLKYSKKIVEKLCWTSQGTIDRKKTAEVLTQENSDLGLWICYKLACVYCLDSTDLIHQQLLENNLDTRRLEFNSPLIVLFFSSYLEGGSILSSSTLNDFRGEHTITVYEYMFRYSAVYGFEEATKYFFKHLNFDQKEIGLMKAAKYVLKSICKNFSKKEKFESYSSNVLCFLLCKMNVEQRLQLFKSHPFEILISFLDTPLQYFFIEISKEVWPFLNEDDYDCLITIIIKKLLNKDNQFDYTQLFRDFWCLSPASCKQYVIDRYTYNDFLLHSLFDLEDETNIKLFFNCATIEEKKTIIFSSNGKSLCAKLIDFKKYELFELLVKLCLFSSKETMSKFKREFKDYILLFYPEESTNMWNVAYKIIGLLYAEIPYENFHYSLS